MNWVRLTLNLLPSKLDAGLVVAAPLRRVVPSPRASKTGHTIWDGRRGLVVAVLEHDYL